MVLDHSREEGRLTSITTTIPSINTTNTTHTTTTTTATTTDSCANPDPRGPEKLQFACAAVVFVGRVSLCVEIFHSFTTDIRDSAPTHDVTHSRTMAWYLATAEKTGVSLIVLLLLGLTL